MWYPLAGHILIAKILNSLCLNAFRYEDGTGGCDGCLNWAGMGWNSHSMEIKVKLSQMLAFQMIF